MTWPHSPTLWEISGHCAEHDPTVGQEQPSFKEVTSELDLVELVVMCARQRDSKGKVLRQASWLVEGMERRSTGQAEEEGADLREMGAATGARGSGPYPLS